MEIEHRYGHRTRRIEEASRIAMTGLGASQKDAWALEGHYRHTRKRTWGRRGLRRLDTSDRRRRTGTLQCDTEAGGPQITGPGRERAKACVAAMCDI